VERRLTEGGADLSENITHTGIVDDCARLAGRWDAICAPFRLCFREHLEFARLGAVTRAGDTHNPRLLGLLRDRWPEKGDEPLTQHKLAFVLGWMGHRAADRQMKPVFRSADPDCPRKPTDCSVYHDAFVLREVYGGGSGDPYSPFVVARQPSGHPAAGAVPVEALEDLFGVIWQRAMIRMHTFSPDNDNVEVWLERLFEERGRLYVDIHRYTEALLEPDPDKVRRFIEDVDFYDADDAIIRIARGLQRGEDVKGGAIGDAVAASARQSHYAQAVGKAMGYLQAASDYFERKLDEDTLNERLDIGKPGG
jgi:hypothetical protein